MNKTDKHIALESATQAYLDNLRFIFGNDIHLDISVVGVREADAEAMEKAICYHDFERMRYDGYMPHGVKGWLELPKTEGNDKGTLIIEFA